MESLYIYISMLVALSNILLNKVYRLKISYNEIPTPKLYSLQYTVRHSSSQYTKLAKG